MQLEVSQLVDLLRREFLGYERLVSTLYSAVKPDPAALEFCRSRCLPRRHRRRHPRDASVYAV